MSTADRRVVYEETRWEDLLERLHSYNQDPSQRWIFRGVSNIKDHHLLPSVGRPGARKNPINGQELPFSIEEEKRMVSEFYRKARPYFRQEPAGLLETLAIAQHHGMPTRLLDWTESLFVAAFFGAKGGGAGEKQGGVYAVRVSGLPILEAKANPFEMSVPVALYWPSHIAPRIPAQQGLFTVHWQPDAVPFHPNAMEVLEFPLGPETFRIKRMLDECGINEASLFPDIIGLARYTGWRYKWSRLDPT